MTSAAPLRRLVLSVVRRLRSLFRGGFRRFGRVVDGLAGVCRRFSIGARGIDHAINRVHRLLTRGAILEDGRRMYRGIGQALSLIHI